MALYASEGGSGNNYEPIPEGTYPGICYSIVDLGDQYSEKYDKVAHKCRITWEVVGETIEVDGKEINRSISKEYTLSLSTKSNLRADLMRVPKSMVKSAPEKAIEHAEARLTSSIFLNVLSGTRAQVKLQNTFETREGGITFAVTPDIHVPGKTARIDFSALYLMPDGGVFNAPGDSGFNNAAGISSRRILRVLRPSAVGLFAMPGEGAIVPLLYVYTQYPVNSDIPF